MTRRVPAKARVVSKPRPPTRATDARTVALDVLERVEEGAYANVVLPVVLRRSGLDERDRAFTTDLVYGTLRRQLHCDWLLSQAITRPLARVDRPVRVGLRLGTYQLLVGVAPHAAVSATVDAIGRRAPRARGFANAVLRRVQSFGPQWPFPTGDDAASLAVRLSYPQWIVELLVAQFGAADAVAMLEMMNQPPMVTLRPNPRRTTVEALTDDLRESGIDVAAGSLVAGALLVRGIGDPAALTPVVDGRASPQDQASQAVVDLLDVNAGLRVLDVAAAPGGKATAAAERVGDAGMVTALDVHAGRASLISRAARRLGVDGVLHVVVGNGGRLPLRPDALFDRVLVDAPCSGLGVLRRRPEARWRIEPGDLDGLVTLQQALLAEAAATVAPGGILTYSVCTVHAPETTGIDGWLETDPRFADFAALDPPPPPWRPASRGALLLPHDAGTDGMFLLRLRRRGRPDAQNAGGGPDAP